MNSHPVILLSHGFQSEYEIGFANGLARNGVPVRLIGSDSTLLSRREVTLEVVNLRGSQESNRPPLAKALNIARYIVSYLLHIGLRRGASIHVIGMFSTGSTVLSLLEAWLTRLFAGKYLLTVHNVLPHDRHTRFNRWAFGAIYRAPGMLMVHTRRTGETLQREYGIPASQIVVVEHGFDRLILPDLGLRQRFRAAIGVPEQARVALFFGQIHRYKGVDLLLEAFDRAGGDASLHLVIAGLCRDGALREELESAIRAHRYRDRIHWRHGFVADEEVPALMQAADCMVMPYRNIDQSGVLFMAMSAGLPVVATDVGSLRDYVRDGAVVPAGDTDALAEALSRTLSAVSFDERLKGGVSRYEWRNTLASLASRYLPVRSSGAIAGEAK